MFSTAPESSSRELAAGKTPREMAYYLVLGLLAVTGLALAIWYFDPFGGERAGRARPTGERLRQGELDPREFKLGALNLALLTDNDNELKLRELKGKVVLLSFWGPWNDSSSAEVPVLAELEAKYRDDDRVRIVAVSIPPPKEAQPLETLQHATQLFIDRFAPDHADWRVYVDPDGVTHGAVESVINLKGYPAALLLDREHFVRRSWNGPQSSPDYEAVIAAALKEGRDE